MYLNITLLVCSIDLYINDPGPRSIPHLEIMCLKERIEHRKNCWEQKNDNERDFKQAVSSHIAERWNTIEECCDNRVQCDIDSRDQGSGHTALMMACGEINDKYVVKYLNEQDTGRKTANTSIKDQDGQTALHHATVHGNVSICELLLKKNADLSVQSVCGNTPLMCAIMYGMSRKPDIVKLLVEYDKENKYLELANNERETALSCAQDERYDDIIAILEKKPTMMTLQHRMNCALDAFEEASVLLHETIHCINVASCREALSKGENRVFEEFPENYLRSSGSSPMGVHYRNRNRDIGVCVY